LQKSGTLREVLRALQENRAVGFLLDHNVISHDLCFVDFFGIKTSASTVFAKIAARSGAPVVPGFAVWSRSERRYVLRFEKPIAITGDAQRDTQAIHGALERVIRRNPEQWLWIHRRFKTRPPGEASLYD
jgi:KDO2-lipid IV(A) lauroyltransferase